MAISQQEIHDKISAAFPTAEFEIEDLVGDGNHYQLNIRAKEFDGLSRVAQHKLVYAALGECVGGDLHALALKTEILL